MPPIRDYGQEIWFMSTTSSPPSKPKMPQRQYRPRVHVPLLLVQQDPCEHRFSPMSAILFAQGNTRRLRRFDESNQSKIASQATTPPRSVFGIGGKGVLC